MADPIFTKPKIMVKNFSPELREMYNIPETESHEWWRLERI
jgi:hypothetical protein